MQPANLSLDPMASLWSTGASPNNNNNNWFSTSNPSASPPNDQGTNSSAQSRPNEGNPWAEGFYTSPQQNQGGQMLKQGAAQGQAAQEGAGVGVGTGDAFMGAITPGPGGMGFGGGWWKSTVMDENK